MKTLKPLGRKSYGHIPHFIGSRMTPADKHCEPGHQRIMTEKTRDRHDLIIVQEKLDGSNCAVAKIDGEIVALGRAGYLAITSPYLQHRKFDEWVELNRHRFIDLLDNGERVVGEWMIQACGTRYNLPHEPFVVFDIMIDSVRLNYHDFLLRVLPLGFVIPRLIHIGQSFRLKDAMDQIQISGHGAIDPVEGVVYRCERKGKVDFLGKYVRPEKTDGYYLPGIGENTTEIWNQYEIPNNS